MRFIALKTEDGAVKGKLSLYCRALGVSRQGFYKYLVNRDRPWKYQALADAMLEILAEDACNDQSQGRQALRFRHLRLFRFHGPQLGDGHQHECGTLLRDRCPLRRPPEHEQRGMPLSRQRSLPAPPEFLR